MGGPRNRPRRTTNACETLHSYFAEYLHPLIPNILEFLTNLKDKQGKSAFKLISCQKGQAVRKKRDINQELESSTIIASYRSQELSKKNFFRQIAYKMLLVNM
ncbi:hypothetical protein ElyMa_001293700 [Elysia marginata]|uniref:Uncharacterized protein n=1 Tax=Elysia marginata TaxID=1093978 RepID=A0AAV4IG14_9GAST|nr:hypothetical protein ElyMa_001293700 [Elysia marginata]